MLAKEGRGLLGIRVEGEVPDEISRGSAWKR
jgi:hypothetical protein